MTDRFNQIAIELRKHAPFTIFGALIGLIFFYILIYGNYLYQISPISDNIFFILHSLHIFFSALVTTTLFARYSRRKLWIAIVIGYTGSIGIATISDSFIPFIGEILLNLPNANIHIGL